MRDERLTGSSLVLLGQDEACRIASSAPGVGNLMAIAFVTSVDDPARLSKAGDRLTRKLLFEVATVILYRASPSIALKQWRLRLGARSGNWKARVGLARKLAVTVLTMWKTNTMFENRSCTG